MIDLPAILPIVVAAWGVIPLGLAVAGGVWLIRDWRRAPRGGDALNHWDGGGR